ncbi:Yip1 family protein [Sedimentitalea sp. JM2-8]|uniref:Yip1 family protein n=1 Tax=Sedimentitalea xiamensis TaxID=3050037 RepID=A0ABT7FCF4_9RHOB|nr:Yip1 family protein [Sedimentitalea xiamensis]MDK3072708.1 Yip1 family protein [Sedimentitalea xiamensis]
MTLSDLRQLAILSIKDPAQAARMLLTAEPAREALWTALAVVAVLNAILFTLSNMLVSGPVPLPGMLSAPVVYCLLVAGGLILTIHALFWSGRVLGGTGTIDDIMTVVLWLQALRLVAQVAVMVLLLFMPLFSALLVFAVSLYGLYMLLHFINQAHRLDSLGRSAGVLVGAMLAIVLGLTLLLSLFGGSIIGSNPYV